MKLNFSFKGFESFKNIFNQTYLLIYLDLKSQLVTITMQKLSNIDGSYSATCNSQPLTFIESDFVGAENTQATEFNYELTFPNDTFHTQQHSQQLNSQMDNIDGSQVCQ